MLLIQIAGGAVLVFLILALLLRGRVVGRTGSSSTKAKTRADFRPTLPPSPYQPSRGFRMLDGVEPVEPPTVALPRLDPNKEFVFNDTQATSGDTVSPPHLRHDERWALDRSMRHAPPPRLRRRLAWAVVVLVLATGLAAALLLHHSPATAHHAGLALLSAVGML